MNRRVFNQIALSAAGAGALQRLWPKEQPAKDLTPVPVPRDLTTHFAADGIFLRMPTGVLLGVDVTITCKQSVMPRGQPAGPGEVIMTIGHLIGPAIAHEALLLQHSQPPPRPSPPDPTIHVTAGPDVNDPDPRLWLRGGQLTNYGKSYYSGRGANGLQVTSDVVFVGTSFTVVFDGGCIDYLYLGSRRYKLTPRHETTPSITNYAGAAVPSHQVPVQLN